MEGVSYYRTTVLWIKFGVPGVITYLFYPVYFQFGASRNRFYVRKWVKLLRHSRLITILCMFNEKLALKIFFEQSVYFVGQIQYWKERR